MIRALVVALVCAGCTMIRVEGDCSLCTFTTQIQIHRSVQDGPLIDLLPDPAQ